MQLTIQRSQPGAARSMDLLEHSARTIEEFMGEEFPVRYVGILFKKGAHAAEGSAGANFGHVITQIPKYDVDDGSRAADFLPRLTAHEIAHYYWRGNEDWIDEGAATFMEFIVENARTGAPLVADHVPCEPFANLGELDRANPRHPSDGGPRSEFLCNYSLGERLFLDLYRTLGREQFRQGFRHLYLAVKNRSVYGGIEELETAFKKDAPPEVVSAVDTVINRWYHGAEPYDLSHLDTAPVDPSLPSINGRIESANIILDPDKPDESITSSISVDQVDEGVYLWLDWTFPRTKNPKNITLWYAEYYEDGFMFEPNRDIFAWEPGWDGGWSYAWVWPPASDSARPGRYGVMVYDGERKVAQVEYQIVP